MTSEVSSTFRTDPKKSVIGTLNGSLGNKSVRFPTVEIQRRLGQTCKKSPMVFL